MQPQVEDLCQEYVQCFCWPLSGRPRWYLVAAQGHMLIHFGGSYVTLPWRLQDQGEPWRLQQHIEYWESKNTSIDDGADLDQAAELSAEDEVLPLLTEFKKLIKEKILSNPTCTFFRCLRILNPEEKEKAINDEIANFMRDTAKANGACKKYFADAIMHCFG